MSKAYIFIADGFEEIEGLMCVDLMRRAGIEVKMFSIKDDKNVIGARGINVITDHVIDEIDDSADMLILPGGMPGTNYLNESDKVKKKQRARHQYLTLSLTAFLFILITNPYMIPLRYCGISMFLLWITGKPSIWISFLLILTGTSTRYRIRLPWTRTIRMMSVIRTVMMLPCLSMAFPSYR